MTDKAARRLLEGQAWEDFCEQLKVAGKVIEEFGDEASDQDRAEWYRFLSRITRNGFERFVENCEPERPRLRDAPWRQSINVQNPDQDHFLSEFVDGSHDYIIRGNRGTLPYFVIAAWTAPQPTDLGEQNWAHRGIEALKEFDPSNLGTTAFLMSDDIDFDAQGNFEVTLSQQQPAGNWMRLDADTTGVLIRTVHHDRNSEIVPSFTIERLDNPKPRPISPAEMSSGLAKAGQTVLGYAELVRDWWFNNLGQRPNTIEFSESTYLSNGGVLDRLHGFGSWEKPKGMALIVEFNPPECESWIFQLCNLWQENLDVYEDGQGYINKFTASYLDDGLIRAVIADEDPAIDDCNWIDSFQHEKGVFSLRLIKTEGGPAVTIYSVPLQQLKESGLSTLSTVTPINSGQVTE